MTAVYDFQKVNLDRSQRGLRRYSDLLPYSSFPSLGEGATPIIELNDLARQIGVRHVWVKNEAQNPTGSHKDRMSPLIMARAKNMGYSTVVAASTGNAGVSIASYSAASGLKCCIICTNAIQQTYAKAIKMTGAKIIYTQSPLSRWECMDYQLQKTITDTNGLVKVVNIHNALQGQRELGKYGLYLERSSASIWSALMQLKNSVNESDGILAISTSHGFKE